MRLGLLFCTDFGWNALVDWRQDVDSSKYTEVGELGWQAVEIAERKLMG